MEAHTLLKDLHELLKDKFRSGKIVFRVKSEFNDILVLDNENIRHLYFLGGKYAENQSAINLTNLKEDIFKCNVMMKRSLEFVVNPKRILVIGMGAGVIPRYISEEFPDTIVDIVDIDSEVFSIAEKYFYFNKKENINYIVGDCYQVCSTLKFDYDIIISDAFSKDYIPFHAMSLEFFEIINKILSDKGVYCCNVANFHPSFESHVYTLSHVFGDNIRMLEMDGVGNSIIFCSKCEFKVDIPEFDLSKISDSHKFLHKLFFR